MYGPGLLGDATQDAITALSQQISDLNNQLAMETPGTPSFISIQTQLTVLNTQRAQLQGQATASDTPSAFFTGLSSIGDSVTGALSALPSLAKYAAIGLVAYFGIKAIGGRKHG